MVQQTYEQNVVLLLWCKSTFRPFLESLGASLSGLLRHIPADGVPAAPSEHAGQGATGWNQLWQQWGRLRIGRRGRNTIELSLALESDRSPAPHLIETITHQFKSSLEGVRAILLSPTACVDRDTVA
jgi:hypothetical protein